MRARLVAASGLTVLVTASTSLAAPPWSEPRSIGAPTGIVSGETIAFGPGGSALLSRRTSADGGQSQDDSDRLATVTHDGKLVDHGRLSDRLAAPPLLFGRGRVALLRERLLSEEAPQRVRLSVSMGSTARPAGRGRAHRLATFTTLPSGRSAAMTVGPQGQIAIVWMTYRGDTETGRFRVRLALRRPNGPIRTHTVASGTTDQAGDYDPPGLAVAIGARGDVIVAYSAVGQSIRVRTLRRGRRFGRPQALGPHAGAVDLEARASRTGRTVVAWATQDGGEEFSEPYVVRAALLAPGATRFGPTQVIDPGELNREFVPRRLRLAMTADGTAALAWSNSSGRFPDLRRPVRAAVAEREGGFGPFVELAADGFARDVALHDDGAALVTWSEPGRMVAAQRAGPSQPFGPPELIASSAPGEGSDRQAAAAYDPRTGRPTVIWTATGGPDQLQLSTRSG